MSTESRTCEGREGGREGGRERPRETVRRVEKRTLVTNLLVGGLGCSVLALFQITICLEK